MLYYIDISIIFNVTGQWLARITVSLENFVGQLKFTLACHKNYSCLVSISGVRIMEYVSF